MGKLDGSIPPGGTVWVRKIDLKDDRIELLLSRKSNETTAEDYAKLKVMLGKGYRTRDAEGIIEVIAHGIRVERFEKLFAVGDAYTRLKQQLAEAEQAYRAANPSQAKERRAAAIRLSKVCRDLASNRNELIKLGRPNAEGADFEKRAKAFDDEIIELAAAEKRAALRELPERIKAAIAAETRLADENPKATALNKAELQRRSDLLKRRQGAVDAADELIRQFEAAGGTAAPADAQWSKQARQRLTILEAGIETDQQKLAAADLEDQFKSMELKRKQLDAAYIGAFGSPRERAALDALKAQIRTMYENRVAAAKLGNRTASARAAQLLKDLAKFP